MNKMKVEIWSDIACPFCYIGKRNFETGLEQFSGKESIQVEWKSFQLDPTVPETAVESQEDYLIKRKGMSREQVQGMLAQVTDMAQQAGLTYHLDKTVMANTQKAHLLLQFAKTQNRTDEMEERLFRAYFTEGENVADVQTLTRLGTDAGLDEQALQAAFTEEAYRNGMAQDIREAGQIGVKGVPFFVFNRKYAVSGAQPPQAFLETLEKSFSEWRKENPEMQLEITAGQSCDVDGNCQ